MYALVSVTLLLVTSYLGFFFFFFFALICNSLYFEIITFYDCIWLFLKVLEYYSLIFDYLN